MSAPFVSYSSLPEFSLWKKLDNKRSLSEFELEITARCNLNCRHCYINLPANDKVARKNELSLEEIKKIADEAVSLGALWCLITGGEPLIREDFFDIYLVLKRMGLLVSVFTNGTLITEKHVQFLKRYPPRDIEITVYGLSKKTYENVTRMPGSFSAFTRGLKLLLEGGVKVNLKTMALRSNVHEMQEIANFCRKRTEHPYRFDPFLNLRYDGNQIRNEEIMSERLAPMEIVALERSDTKRFSALERACDKLIVPGFSQISSRHLFGCGVGTASGFTLGYDGTFRLCSSLWHKDCISNIRKGTLFDAWRSLAISVLNMKSNRKEFLEKCRVCPIINLCMWCPAHAHLETGEMDTPVEYFCNVAHARVAASKKT